MTQRLFCLVVLVLALLSYSSNAFATETQSALITVKWESPNTDPLWQWWMTNRGIVLSVTIMTDNGIEICSAYATVGQEQAFSYCTFDVTNLPDNYQWILSAKLPPQTLTGGWNQSVTIFSLSKSKILKEDDGFQQTIDLGRLILKKNG